jgi:hypothetical protein
MPTYRCNAKVRSVNEIEATIRDFYQRDIASSPNKMSRVFIKTAELEFDPAGAVTLVLESELDRDSLLKLLRELDHEDLRFDLDTMQ